MKNSVHYAKLLKKLCNKLQREEGVHPEAEPLDATSTLVLAVLSEVTTESKARKVLDRIQHYFVDFNEMRVCGKDELVEVLGKNFPHVRERAGILVNILKQMYNQLDGLDLDIMHENGKREAKAFLESLGNITPYVVSSVMMHSFGAHAFPINDFMLQMLRQEEVVAVNADMANVQGFLERQISATEIRKIYAILRRHADKLYTSNSSVARGNTKKKSKTVARKSTRTKSKKAVKKVTKTKTTKTKKKNTHST